MVALFLDTAQRSERFPRAPLGIRKQQARFRFPRFTSPPGCQPKCFPETRRCPFSTKEPETKKKKKKLNAIEGVQATGLSKFNVQKTVCTRNSSRHRSCGSALPAARLRPGGGTYGAEPTLLSLLASTLAGLASSTSGGSSVIGAASGGNRQLSAPSTVRGAGPASRAARIRAGRAPGPPTWTRSRGRDWSPGARGPRGREGAGRGEVTALLPNPGGRS